MKKILLSIALCVVVLFSRAQTATNFNVNDCAGTNHDLFTELNSNKVIVLFWVMPCGACIGPALTGYNAVQGYQGSNPNTVFFYLVDDVGDISCSSLNTWANTNGMTNCARFSNSAIDMNDYGGYAMQKCVVLGGNSHSTYFNGGGTAITTSAVQGGINAALAAIAAGVKENQDNYFASVSVFPNPGKNSTISFELIKDSKVSVEIQDELGRKISEVYSGNLQKGSNKINVNTSHLNNGIYFISFSDGLNSKKTKLLVQ